MKKTAVKKKPSLKEPAPKESPDRRFSVTLVVEGHMLDQDTPIGEESLAALFQLHFQSEKTLKVRSIEVKEIK